MGFSLGIVGLPNIGKTTLFNALTGGSAKVSNFPFCTIDSNVGVTFVPDERPEKLAKIFNAPKSTQPQIKFADVAGLIKGSSQGEGLGNQFLSYIRPLDGIIHLVRCFTDPEVAWPADHQSVQSDVGVINAELCLADLEITSRKLAQVAKEHQSRPAEHQEEYEFLTLAKDALSRGRFLRTLKLTTHQAVLANELGLITAKPCFYVANLDERELEGKKGWEAVQEIAKQEGTFVLGIDAQLEEELRAWPEEEAKQYRQSLDRAESGLAEIIKSGYRLLDLITFFTANQNEARGWTLAKGGDAGQAAGQVHTDMQKGFIKVEVINFDKLVEAGSMAAAHDKGYIQIEGREYVVKEADVLHFKFRA